LIPTFELPEEHQKIYEEALEIEKNDYYENPPIPNPFPPGEKGDRPDCSFFSTLGGD
jgi:hypothetical protein